MKPIPFNRPRLAGPELEYISDAVARAHISGDGVYTRHCQELIESIVGTAKALLTTSCTDALEMAALLLEIGPEDEVIVPSFTFVSTANAFVLRGARPVFADIRPDTLNLDENALESLISRRTKAVVLVHYAGVACEMDPILALAARCGVRVVEDNAHGFLGEYRGRALGSMGTVATLSFHETKNISCGEGGALLINDPSLVDRAEILREKGTDRSRFFRGLVDKYTWVDLGSSFLPSDLLAAFLLAQLEARDEIQRRRRRVWIAYAEGLADWAREGGIGLPRVPAHCTQPYHLFYLLMRSLEERQALIDHLRVRGVHAVFHYLPLHLSPQGRSFGGRPGACPVAESVSDRLLRLPLFADLADCEVARVIDAVTEFRPR